MSLAALGVLLFSGTFPATVFALRGFDAVFVGAGRSVGAAVLAAVVLRCAGVPLPTRRQLHILLAVVPGVGIGYGVLTAVALEHVTASHAAVVTGLLPAATATVAVWRAGERPSWQFWGASLVGAAVVVTFALRQGTGQLTAADLLLLGALALGGLGYAEGARLAREMPGWQVISWTVIMALPLSLPITIAAGILHPPHPAADSLVALLFLCAVTMFLAFFAWYKGLAAAGIARASQLQLAQPFLTIALSAVLLAERPGADSYVTAGIVLACVVAAQRARHRRVPVDAPSWADAGGPSTL